VARRVRERLLADAIDRDPDPGRDPRDVVRHLQLDVEPAGTRLFHERRDLLDRRQWRRHAGLVIAAEQGDRSTELLHAPAAHLLGRQQCVLGSLRIAAQHVAGARDLQHDGREPVSDEVVHVPRDLSAFGQPLVLGQLAPRVLELRRELLLPDEHAGQGPREADPEDPDGDGNLGRVLREGDQTGVATASAPSGTALRSDGAQWPTTKASRETSNMIGSSSPERCAMTTATTTAIDRASSGVLGT
jgi:hypothetical protein